MSPVKAIMMDKPPLTGKLMLVNPHACLTLALFTASYT